MGNLGFRLKGGGVMFIHEHLTQLCQEHSIPWDLEHPKFIYVITQVLVFFDVHCEDDIPVDAGKLEATEAIFQLALEDDLTIQEQVYLNVSKEWSDQVKGKIRRLYDFLAADDLSDFELQRQQEIQETEWSKENG